MLFPPGVDNNPLFWYLIPMDKELQENYVSIQVDGLSACVHAAEEGGYWAEVPALPGCLTQGETLDEIVENLNDAIEGWLSVQTPQSLREKGVSLAPHPRVRTLELAA